MVCPMCTKQQHGLCRYPASCSCQHRVASMEPTFSGLVEQVFSLESEVPVRTIRDEAVCCTVDEPCMAHSAEPDFDCCSNGGACGACGLGY